LKPSSGEKKNSNYDKYIHTWMDVTTQASQEMDPEAQAVWAAAMLSCFLLFLIMGEEVLAYCCAFPMMGFFSIGWYFSTEEMRVEKAAKATRSRAKWKREIEAADRKKKREKEAADRKKAELKERREQFAKWMMKNYSNYAADTKFWDKKSPEYKAKWDEWEQEIKDNLAAEKAAREELARMEAKAEAERKKAAAAIKKAAAAEKKAAAAAKKKQIQKDKESLRKALVDIQKRGLSKKIDNVSRHSFQSLLSVTKRFDGIRKTGTLDQLKKSILSNFKRWTTQLAKIQELNAELTKDSTLEDIVRIEQDPSIDKTKVKHPELKKKATNLRGRIERRKEKLERVRKEAAFSRPMLQTQDVPNATLLRKEKAWKLNDGCCTRCNKPSSEMAFYWDVYPDLLLVVICDDCSSKEEFVHAQEPGEEVEEDVDDLADVFMRAVGTSEKKRPKK